MWGRILCRWKVRFWPRMLFEVFQTSRSEDLDPPLMIDDIDIDLGDLISNIMIL